MKIRIPTRGIVAASCGLIATGLALGSAELAAAAIRPQASPLITVGQSVIDATPTPVKEWAIEMFKFKDKLVLQGSILVLLAIFAAVIGVLAARRLWIGFVGVGLFGFVGILAAVSRPASQWADPIPAVLGAVVGGVGLWLLVTALPPRDLPARKEPVPIAGSETGPEEAGTEDAEPIGETAHPGDYSRRRLLILTSALSAGAIAAGTLGRLLQGVRYNATKSRNAVKLPKPVSVAAPVSANADLKLPGVTAYVTPNSEFYKVDTTLVVPQVRTQDWELRIHGMVDMPISYTFDELLELPM
ncbi:MAG: hypothetical protein ACRDTD_33085, partial [Pseudonocardiaceae bacterium]